LTSEKISKRCQENYLGDLVSNQNLPASPIVISAQLSSSKGFPPCSTIFGLNRITDIGFSILEFKSIMLSSVQILHIHVSLIPSLGRTDMGPHPKGRFEDGFHFDNTKEEEDLEYIVCDSH
jgi:hypothetical protein